MTHFNAELWIIHQLCVLQVLNKKRNNSNKKSRKLAKAEMSRHNFKVTNGAMLQQEMICHNKEEAELKLEVKIVTTFHNFVTT